MLIGSRSELLFLDQCIRSCVFINYGPILILLHIHVKYDNIFDKFACYYCRSKIKVAVAILRKLCRRYSAFYFLYNFTQNFSVSQV